jgi:hypothetical protein
MRAVQERLLPFPKLASPHQANHHTPARKRRRLAAVLILCPCRWKRTRVAHVVPGGLDPAVETLNVRVRNSSIWPLKGSAMPRTCCRREKQAT